MKYCIAPARADVVSDNSLLLSAVTNVAEDDFCISEHYDVNI